MGLFERVERGLERAVSGAFARAFKSEVEPVEIASAIRRAMDDRAAVVARGRTLVPNRFAVELSDTDYDRLTDLEDELADELIASAEEHAESQRYTLGGPVEVDFIADPDLETGVFRLRASSHKRTSAGAGAGGGAGASVGASAEAGLSAAPARDTKVRHAAPVPLEPSAAAAARPAAPQPSPATRHTGPAPTAPQRSRVLATDRPWLEVDGERYPLLGAITVLGRDDTADIVLDDPGVSRRHSELRVTTDGPRLVTTIRDLQSTNGTYVEGSRINSEHLADGNRITVGRTSLVYRVRRR